MTDKKEMTARYTSVGADDGQSLKTLENSIAEKNRKINTAFVKWGCCEWLN